MGCIAVKAFTDVDEKNGTEHRQPIWRRVSGRLELAEPCPDNQKGDDDGNDPVYGRYREHSCIVTKSIVRDQL